MSTIRVLSIAAAMFATAVIARAGTAITTWGECAGSDRVWVMTQIWSNSGPGDGDLLCSMGTDCNGGSWNSCGATALPPNGDLLNEIYTPLPAGASPHITSLTRHSDHISVTSDVPVTYTTFSLVTGTKAYDGQSMVGAGVPSTIGISGWPVGPYMVVARDVSGRVVGYRAFLH